MKKLKRLPNGKTVLCLRTIEQDGSEYEDNSFRCPKKGYVKSPNLYGLLKGIGDIENILLDGLFQVVKVLEKEVVHFDGMVKFPRCEVVFTGSQKEATDILVKEYPEEAIMCAYVVSGNNGTATTGYAGTAITGDGGTAIAGNNGTATAGYCGTAITGDGGTAIAGNDGTARTGECGKASVGYKGTASAGTGGIINIYYYDDRYLSKRRQAVGYVGEDGIEANVMYKLD